MILQKIAVSRPEFDSIEPENHTSNKVLRDADAVVQGPHFENYWLQGLNEIMHVQK